MSAQSHGVVALGMVGAFEAGYQRGVEVLESGEWQGAFPVADLLFKRDEQNLFWGCVVEGALRAYAEAEEGQR